MPLCRGVCYEVVMSRGEYVIYCNGVSRLVASSVAITILYYFYNSYTKMVYDSCLYIHELKIKLNTSICKLFV